MRHFIGWTLVALPFLGMTTAMVHDQGWLFAVGIWGVVALIVGCIVIGVQLTVS